MAVRRAKACSARSEEELGGDVHDAVCDELGLRGNSARTHGHLQHSGDAMLAGDGGEDGGPAEEHVHEDSPLGGHGILVGQDAARVTWGVGCEEEGGVGTWCPCGRQDWQGIAAHGCKGEEETQELWPCDHARAEGARDGGHEEGEAATLGPAHHVEAGPRQWFCHDRSAHQGQQRIGRSRDRVGDEHGDGGCGVVARADAGDAADATRDKSGARDEGGGTLHGDQTLHVAGEAHARGGD
mmetsp:Transcript_30043/g.80684  ORF Transcript_30043/g.80684 Transcript_30043/m.80684 type:complete len:240 (-) Transcript_30043:1290-2009(-)